MGKSTCPTCHQALSTPSTMNPQEWASFVCPNCKARLQLKPTSRSIFLILLGIYVTQLGDSHVAPRWLWPLFFVTGITFFFAAAVFLILEQRRPKLKIKKPLPKPEIFLNLSSQ